jgi:lysozyme
MTNADTVGIGMTKTEREIARKQLIVDEGLRLKPYYCTADKLTIGYGRNLDDKGISKAEAEAMLDNDIAECEAELLKKIPDVYKHLTPNRKAVLLNMCFNLGIKGLLGFKNTLKLIQMGEYKQASEAMLKSKWAEQVKNRAKRLSELMKNG